ncbi:hypothetical protein [Oceanobacillus sp. AG]|uniref:DUF2651 family protein n=1 Tax=Oceanobacillus sp. AG TaxID=2681969 RepID=UPI0012EBEA7D|nr:hypothetical protein [Oceanobacillus sp. AG]
MEQCGALHESQAVIVFYPLINFLIGLLSFILFKKLWPGPLFTLLGGMISSIIFLDNTFWLWIIVYTLVSLLGSAAGMGIEKIKYSKVKVTLKVFISLVGVLIASLSLVVLLFIMAMTPDKSEERKVMVGGTIFGDAL